ncbi:hypothetical protein [Methylovirgula sp. 4M-Z18]|uniref:hypothetical protein n=1 Tax=Methylovirgula sp. 4M-Z18 TaxID=2293567 RepID=UPI000E2E8F1B|nr:hypothetical protein [Methylovirgula sp. 4M-Z18]RFB80000.1 hypothetical protein DYH55_00140 [Methylovirgula sp. 4M-Z18]
MIAPLRLLFLTALVLCGFASFARAEDFGPKDVAFAVLGVPLHVPVRGTYMSEPEDGNLNVTIVAHGDLQAVQAHALELARALRMPPPGCGHKTLNATLTQVTAARIVADGAVARVEISGDASVALCKKILGLKVEGILDRQKVSMTAPVELYLRDPNTIGLRLAGRASLQTGQGPLGDAVRDFEGNLNDLLTKRLQSALDAKAAHANLPTLPGVDLAIDHARFAAEGDRLTVEVQAHGTMSQLAFAALRMFFKP